MRKFLFCCVVFIGFTSVLCGLLVPKDTSYGYVPKGSKIFKYPSDQDKWRPYAATGSRPETSADSDTIVVNAPYVNGRTKSISNDSLANDSQIQNVTTQIRSPKSAKYSSTFYYYEPPPPGQYLPPPLDTIPSDYTTPSPTDEEFINRPSHDVPQDVPDNQGYNYDIPETPFNGLLPPISQDEPLPIAPSPQYLPIPPGISLDTPSYSPYGVILAKTPNTANTKQLPFYPNDNPSLDGVRTKQRGPLHVEVTEMHCFATPTDGKFHAVLTVKSPNENVPVFEDISQPESSPCFVKSDFVPPRSNTRLHVLIPKAQFNDCAVKDCSLTPDVVHLCVRLRFPTIPRMKLAEDPVLTLQCRTQDRIAAHTKHLAINVDNAATGRSGEVARGGARGGLRSSVSLFRRGARGEYGEPLPRGARVPLGELLMLRAQIEPNDGWLSSRLSTVTLSGGGRGSMPLLGPDGCRDGKAFALCPREVRSAPPLGHNLLIRAALFEGMRSGEEVRLSVRMVACLDASDCRAPRCPASRNRRNVGDADDTTSNSGNQTIDTTAVLSFKVVLPDDVEFEQETSRPSNHVPLVVMLLVLSTTIACSSVLIFLKKQGRW